MIDFGSNFRKLREEARLSQEAIGMMLNVSPTVVNRIENNKRKLDIVIVHKLATVMNLNATEVVEALFEGKSELLFRKHFRQRRRSADQQPH